MPSALNPSACWNPRTQDWVFWPKMPSTFSECPFLRLRKLAWSWTARTADPVAAELDRDDKRAPGLRTDHAAGGQVVRALERDDADLVFAPKIPSTVSFAPRAFSRYCSERSSRTAKNS